MSFNRGRGAYPRPILCRLNALNLVLGQIAFRSTLGKILAVVKDAHAAQTTHVSTNEELAALVAKLEAKSFQLMITSAAVTVAGNE